MTFQELVGVLYNTNPVSDNSQRDADIEQAARTSSVIVFSSMSISASIASC